MATAQGFMDPVQQQDGLRSVRNFVSLLSGAMNDQTFAEADPVAYNPANQFGVQGPNGVVIEGKPVVVGATAQSAQAGGATLPPMLIVVGAVVLGYLLLK